ncbi:hypothetical protein PR202_gb17229 [Eleusine coracana subsp. coracana]|uniref:Trichome birefringence-like N-terminal domain-containing protein n=1 Tax=Eleusine coracana subsp. coracana TaxID=191504 RepID=A0AAV5F030_ELECO|nr:hypothetical protein PR202_gb17229 [Eleusine coracana subsp. coracana]
MQKKLQLVNPAAATLPALAVLTLVFLLTSRRQHPSIDAYRSALPSSTSVLHRSLPGSSAAAAARVPKGCDIFRGEWVPDDDGCALPYYTNLSCPLIQEHQNCMKYGRPDRGFLRWRWRPAGCEMPRFDAEAFLDAVRGKSLAFVGDSLARNHMQSLMCLLSKVEYPKDISTNTSSEFKTMHYESYNFTIAIFWSPFLVKANQSETLWNLFLDEPDESWTAGITSFDYVLLSAANWFTRPSVFYEGGRVVACHYCHFPGVPDRTLRYSLRMAFRAALRVLTGDGRFNGTVVVRTLSPTSHFEGGEWDKGGDCRRTRPVAANETRMAGLDLDFHEAQVEEFEKAKKEAAATGSSARMVLMDTTPAMLQRPDGHPSRYGHWPHENVTLYNDCVHWCLPGPIDARNEMLLQMLLPDPV